jgi:hypothetical protein
MAPRHWVANTISPAAIEEAQARLRLCKALVDGSFALTQV